MANTLSKAGPSMAGSFDTFLKSFAAADRSIIGISSKIKELQRVMAQSIKFTAAAQIQQFAIGEIQASIKWVESLNRALTDIAIVAPEVAGELDKVWESLVDGSKQLRVTARDYAEAALIFWQQGLNAEEVQRRTDIVIKAARASNQTAVEMSEQLTAIWNTY